MRNIFRKLTFLTSWYTHVRVRMSGKFWLRTKASGQWSNICSKSTIKTPEKRLNYWRRTGIHCQGTINRQISHFFGVALVVFLKFFKTSVYSSNVFKLRNASSEHVRKGFDKSWILIYLWMLGILTKSIEVLERLLFANFIVMQV